MAIMLGKTYAAFKAAGAPEDMAQAAAEELPITKPVLPRLKIAWRQLREG